MGESANAKYGASTVLAETAMQKDSYALNKLYTKEIEPEILIVTITKDAKLICDTNIAVGRRVSHDSQLIYNCLFNAL